jgi:hypothetical protein
MPTKTVSKKKKIATPVSITKNKSVYFFGNGRAEGNTKMRNELGGKGANLAEMTNIGVPVPPGLDDVFGRMSTHEERGKK